MDPLEKPPQMRLGPNSLQKMAFKQTCKRLGETFQKGIFTCGGSILNKSAEAMKRDPITFSGPIEVAVRLSKDRHKSILHIPIENPSPVGGLDISSLYDLMDELGDDPAGPGYQRHEHLPEFQKRITATARKVVKLKPSQLWTNFDPTKHHMLDDIRRYLPPRRGSYRRGSLPPRVTVELNQLNVFSGTPRPEANPLPASLSFENLISANSSDHHFATLIVCLPCPFAGGRLIISENENDVEFSWNEKSEWAIQWAAFYNHCRYQQPRVTEGHCVSLVFNVYATLENDWPGPTVDAKCLPAYGLLKKVLRTPGFMMLGGVLGYFCVNSYPHTSVDADTLFPHILQGADLSLYSALRAIGLEVNIRPVLIWDGEDNNSPGVGGAADVNSLEYQGIDAKIVFVGDRFKPLQLASDGEESMRETIEKHWSEQTYDKPITWLSQPRLETTSSNNESANLTGYQATVNAVFSYAAIIAVIPRFDQGVRKTLIVDE